MKITLHLHEKPILEGRYMIQGDNFDEFEITSEIGKGTHLKMIVQRDVAP
ncbi:MAG: hypothetical protein P1P89_02115 [Desulfobacterales bacterium]|nr:hypothetical protein [Desulfobacterales bacterium]